MYRYSQLTKRNSALSPLLALPHELIKAIMIFLHDPFDLLSFTFTCSTLFYFPTSSDWFTLAKFILKSWIQSCGPNDQDWKNITLRESAFRRRLQQNLPTSSNLYLNSPTNFPLPCTTIFPFFNNPSTNVLSHPSLRILLSESRNFLQDLDKISTPWFHIAAPVYSIDIKSNTSVFASTRTRPMASFKNPGSDPRPHEHQILLYDLPDLSKPIAILGQDIWEQDYTRNSVLRAWYHPFSRDMMQVAQVVALKHFPRHIRNDKFRIVIVIAFGQRSQPSLNPSNPSHYLSIWLLLKVIEFWIPVYPFTPIDSNLIDHFQSTKTAFQDNKNPCYHINLSDITNIETIEPRQYQTTMRGYFVKLYTAENPKSPLASNLHPTIQLQSANNHHDQVQSTDIQESAPVDCIAVFGVQHSAGASAMVIKKILFKFNGDDNIGNTTYSNKAYSDRITGMTLFPDNSGYERMLVLINQHGRGVIWDWVNDKQVLSLHLPKDFDIPNNQSNNQGNNIPLMAISLPSRIYYWGVNVTPPFSTDVRIRQSNKTPFRIVAVADGSNDEWESHCWNVEFDSLKISAAPLSAPPIVDRNTSYTHIPTNKPTIIAILKTFENKILGVPQSFEHLDQSLLPIRTVAYIMWKNYMIGLSSSLGIFIIDITQPSSQHTFTSHWISFLPNRREILDLAIFGNNLILTLTTGHLVWSFYGEKKSFYFTQEALGHQTSTQ